MSSDARMTIRLKFFTARLYGLSQPPPYRAAGLPFVRATNVKRGRLVRDGLTFVSEDDLPDARAVRLREGDIIVVRSGAYTGDSALVTTEWAGAIAGFDIVVRTLRYGEPRFLAYALLSPSVFEQQVLPLSGRAAQPHLNAEELGGVKVILPSPSVQRRIADYLDGETARIDALIGAKERMLVLLAEKRRALITRVVTRGLDPSFPFRDSGIAWLGEVPAHWETWKVGHLARVGNGSTPNRENHEYWADGSIPWLNSAVVNQDEVRTSGQFVTPTALRECHLPLVSPGSVLVGITGQGKTRGQAVVLSFQATLNQHIAYVTPHAGMLDAWFLRWSLLAAYEFLRRISDDLGGTKGALTCEELASLRVMCPPPAEQRDIVDFIGSEVTRLDSLRVATEQTIALLMERRAALIAAAVTGQIAMEASA